MRQQIEQYFDRLWPINRSLTGNGVRESLAILKELIPLEIHEYPSGEQVFDWTIPKEWEVREAYIASPSGKRLAEFSKNNLHLMGYSVPVDLKMPLEELKEHIFTLPEQPDAIPYLTSYYKERWGFCISHNEFLSLEEGTYHVVIDTELKEGHLTLADCVLKGKSSREILISTYICHPSMANNELSGPLVAAFLYTRLKEQNDRYYTYRFVFVPETIGAITYLKKKGDTLLKETVAGFVVTCIGDPGPFTYKKSKRDTALTDVVTQHVLKHHATDFHTVVDFFPEGSDERQYCSPGFNLPVGSLMRTMYGVYPEYHTSLDNKEFICFDALEESVLMYARITEALELNQSYINQVMFGEPQLGKRGLYPSLGTKEKKSDSLRKMLYILSYSDGNTSLLNIAEKLGCSILDLKEETGKLRDAGLIRVA